MGYLFDVQPCAVLKAILFYNPQQNLTIIDLKQKGIGKLVGPVDSSGVMKVQFML